MNIDLRYQNPEQENSILPAKPNGGSLFTNRNATGCLLGIGYHNFPTIPIKHKENVQHKYFYLAGLNTTTKPVKANLVISYQFPNSDEVHVAISPMITF